MNMQMYVPILKYMQSEEMALRNSNVADNDRITPLIQLVKKFKKIQKSDGTILFEETSQEEILTKALSMITKYLGGYQKVYIDLRPLYDEINSNALSNMLNITDSLFGSNLVPVLSIKELSENNFNLQNKNFISRQGIALRITKKDVSQNFWLDTMDSLKKEGIPVSIVDLIIDYGITDKTDFDHFNKLMTNGMKLEEWRSITLISGAFPKDFTDMKNPDTYIIERSDWLLWKRIVSVFSNVNYGDYLTEHPIYTPIMGKVNPSRTLRYTQEDKWIIMKGQSDSVKDSLKELQYYAHAKILVQGKHLVDNCCVYDSEIIKLSNDHNGNMGSFKKWRLGNLIHHMILTTRQIAKLSV